MVRCLSQQFCEKEQQGNCYRNENKNRNFIIYIDEISQMDQFPTLINCYSLNITSQLHNTVTKLVLYFIIY